jgi:putative ABC transport system ATP-binding protein
LIKVIDLVKTYGQGKSATPALKGVNLQIEQGEFVAVMGRSGSGKSTLLHLLGMLDTPTSGEIWIYDCEIRKLNPESQALFRLSQLGYVFQEFSLITELTLLENVYLPAVSLNRTNHHRQRARSLLETMGLGERLTHYPHEVSGGEQQRAAIARAIINQPKIIFADEPTASLDATSARTVL